MSEQISKYPEVTLKVLKGAGVAVVKGHSNKFSPNVLANNSVPYRQARFVSMASKTFRRWHN